MMPLVLASTSPQRKALLTQLALSFTVTAPLLADETLDAALDFDAALADLAVRKAKSVRTAFPDAAIIGCDTMVVVDGQPLGKPQNKEVAREMLKRLSGRQHEVKSGCALLLPDGQVFSETVTTQVQMALLPERLIEAYLLTEESRNRAGGYAIQGRGAALIESICGSYTNVVGMPLEVLSRWLYCIGEEPFGYDRGTLKG